MLASKTTNGKPKKAIATESVWLGPGRFVSMAAGTPQHRSPHSPSHCVPVLATASTT